MARFHINDRGIKALSAPGGDVDRAVRRAANTAKHRAQANVESAGYGPGTAIAKKIRVDRDGSTPSGRVRYSVSARLIAPNGADLAAIYEGGAREHQIPAKPVLVFKNTGRNRGFTTVVRRGPGPGKVGFGGYVIEKRKRVISFKGYVEHPGTEGIHYMRDAVRTITKQDFLR